MNSPRRQSSRHPYRPVPPAEGVGEEVILDVRGLAVGGAAVGRVVGPEGSPLLGMAGFVSFAAPGETVRAQVRRRAARHLEADLVAVETASPDRVTPPCPHFGVCGGCDLQHMDYAAQLTAKRDTVVGAFRSGGLAAISEGVDAVVPGPAYAYRQRITLHVGMNGQVGYFARRSRELLRPQTCPISFAVIDAWLSRGFTFAGLKGVGIGDDLAVEAADNGLFGVLHLSREKPVLVYEDVAAIQARMEPFFDGGLVIRAGQTLARFGPEEMIRGGVVGASVGGLEEGGVDAVNPEVGGGGGNARREAPGVFSQVNPVVNAALVARIAAFARESGAQTAYDLYAGAGNFALTLAGEGMRVFAVESDPVLVASGRNAVKRADLTEKVVFIASAMEKFLTKQPESVDFVVADPPRAGLGTLAERFLFARYLALVSCDTASAVRDIRTLLEIGWTVQSVTPFDMFAQTGDVELLTCLTRG